MPVSEYSKNGVMWLSEVKLYPAWHRSELCSATQSWREAREKGHP